MGAFMISILLFSLFILNIYSHLDKYQTLRYHLDQKQQGKNVEQNQQKNQKEENQKQTQNKQQEQGPVNNGFWSSVDQFFGAWPGWQCDKVCNQHQGTVCGFYMKNCCKLGCQGTIIQKCKDGRKISHQKLQCPKQKVQQKKQGKQGKQQ